MYVTIFLMKKVWLFWNFESKYLYYKWIHTKIEINAVDGTPDLLILATLEAATAARTVVLKPCKVALTYFVSFFL